MAILRTSRVLFFGQEILKHHKTNHRSKMHMSNLAIKWRHAHANDCSVNKYKQNTTHQNTTQRDKQNKRKRKQRQFIREHRQHKEATASRQRNKESSNKKMYMYMYLYITCSVYVYAHALFLVCQISCRRICICNLRSNFGSSTIMLKSVWSPITIMMFRESYNTCVM